MQFSGKLVNYQTAHVGIRWQLVMHCRLINGHYDYSIIYL